MVRRRGDNPQLILGAIMAEINNFPGERLRSFIERLERLEEEKKALTDDIHEVFSEAKGSGFDTRVLRQIIKLRKMNEDERGEMEAVLSLYKQALEM